MSLEAVRSLCPIYLGEDFSAELFKIFERMRQVESHQPFLLIAVVHSPCLIVLGKEAYASTRETGFCKFKFIIMIGHSWTRFCLFSSKFYTTKLVDLSGIQTRIIGIEGKHVDHLNHLPVWFKLILSNLQIFLSL